MVGVRNGNIVILYAHLSETRVKLGQKVQQGDIIGFSGETGAACLVPHLHFEMRDITKPTLKDMVFNPSFGKPIAKYKDTFTYTVNNTNTQKTLSSLSRLYFGIEDYWKVLREKNVSLISQRKDELTQVNFSEAEGFDMIKDRGLRRTLSYEYFKSSKHIFANKVITTYSTTT